MASNYIDLPAYGDPHWKAPVDTAVDLPATGNLGDARATQDTGVVYVWNGSAWQAGGGGGINALGAFGSSPNSNAATISGGTTLVLQPADGTHPGGVSTGTQTFAGDKTFSGAVAATNLSGTNTGDISLAAVGSSPSANGASLSGQALTLQPADSTHPGLISTGTQSFGGNKTFTGSVAASNISGTNSGDITLTAVGSSPSANGASLSSQALTLQPADATHPGVVTTSAQTFAGAKTLSSNPVFSAMGTAGTLINDGSGNISSSPNVALASIGTTVDGGGAALTTGLKGFIYVPFACTINSVTLLADQSGSCVIDIWKVAYGSFPPNSGNTITASAIPTISSAQKAQDTTLTGWTTSISAGDVLAFNVNSCTTITRVNLILKVTKT